MRIENDVKLDFKDVLIRPKRSALSSRSEVNLKRQFYNLRNCKCSPFDEVLPIIAANMDGVGTKSMNKALSKFGMTTALSKHYSVEELTGAFKTVNRDAWFSMGTSDGDFDKWIQVAKLCDKHTLPTIRLLCIDAANGYTEQFASFVARVRKEASEYHVIMAGNVVTADMTEALILAGADIVKVGIGPGSVCTTRKVAGVGYPQLSAIIECADAAHGLGGLICADGGCTCPGDVAKAFAGGADFVMLGGMLAGHDESEQQIHMKLSPIPNTAGEQWVEFYGSSSEEAMILHNGGVADYRAAEGKCVRIPYRGPVSNTVQEILGGLRSACTYVGADKLKDLSKRTTFVRVTQQTNEVFAGI